MYLCCLVIFIIPYYVIRSQGHIAHFCLSFLFILTPIVEIIIIVIFIILSLTIRPLFNLVPIHVIFIILRDYAISTFLAIAAPTVIA